MRRRPLRRLVRRRECWPGRRRPADLANHTDDRPIKSTEQIGGYDDTFCGSRLFRNAFSNDASTVHS